MQNANLPACPVCPAYRQVGDRQATGRRQAGLPVVGRQENAKSNLKCKIN